MFHFGYSIALVSLSISVFLFLKPLFSKRKWKSPISLIAVALFVTAIFAGILPHAIKFIRIDSCLDGGGRWSYEMAVCEN